MYDFTWCCWHALDHPAARGSCAWNPPRSPHQTVSNDMRTRMWLQCELRPRYVDMEYDIEICYTCQHYALVMGMPKYPKTLLQMY